MLSPKNGTQLERQASIRNQDVDTYLAYLLAQDAEAIVAEQTRREVIQMLHRYLDCLSVDDGSKDCSPIRLTLREESVRKSEYAWLVYVIPSRQPRRWEYIHDVITQQVQAIAEETGLNAVIRVEDPPEP